MASLYDQFLAQPLTLGDGAPSGPQAPVGSPELPASFLSQPLTLSGPPAPTGPSASASVGGDLDLNAIITMIMQSMQNQPQTSGNGIAEIAKVLRPDPLGEVARSNARPSGFTPQAAWDAWGPGARKAAPTSDARRGLNVGAADIKAGVVDPRLAGSPTPTSPHVVAPNTQPVSGMSWLEQVARTAGAQPENGGWFLPGTTASQTPTQPIAAAQGSQDTTGNVGAPWLDFFRMGRPGLF